MFKFILQLLDNIFNPYYFNFKDINSKEKLFIIRKIYIIRKYKLVPLNTTVNQMLRPTGLSEYLVSELFKEFNNYKIKVSKVYSKYENVFPRYIYIIKETNEKLLCSEDGYYIYNYKKVETDNGNKDNIRFRDLI